MTKLQERLVRACGELGLSIKLDCVMRLASGREVLALAHIPELGDTNGMIIVSSVGPIRGYSRELVSEGYGYSMLSEPSLEEVFDLRTFVEMFSDWGWGAGADTKPSWMA